jgi:hypothetical protein
VCSRKCLSSSNSVGASVCATCDCKAESALLTCLGTVSRDWEGGILDSDDSGLSPIGDECSEFSELAVAQSVRKSSNCRSNGSIQRSSEARLLGGLLGYWQFRFIFLHLEHFGVSSSHYALLLGMVKYNLSCVHHTYLDSALFAFWTAISRFFMWSARLEDASAASSFVHVRGVERYAKKHNHNEISVKKD